MGDGMDVRHIRIARQGPPASSAARLPESMQISQWLVAEIHGVRVEIMKVEQQRCERPAGADAGLEPQTIAILVGVALGAPIHGVVHCDF